ncbi:MAG TPA: hypothetical protein VMU84_21010 [Thermoanaerobaculia bacterium]|nr:hypothetical protein [Thermoanaerobaculia bacterium]
MRSATILVLLLATTASAEQFHLVGYVTGRGVSASGPASWLAGGFGRMQAGADRREGFASAQVGFDYEPSQNFDVHVSGLARHDRWDDDAGLVEAYADARIVGANDQLQFRVGQFFLPTSRENKGDLWTSPYTINFSALNSWIGEEFRPIGADLEWKHTTPGGSVYTLAGTAFRGNDTMGALLGWRGWSVGNRLSLYNQVEPLPRLWSLPRWFPDQRLDGTKPFGRDLDGRTGFAFRTRYTLPERFNVQVARVDNRGERELYRGEYAWQTRFTLVSAEFGRTDATVLATEYMVGDTGMGFAPAGWVQADFHAGYVLLSHKRNRNRFSARYDWFAVDERDFSRAEDNTDDGRSWTLTWFYDVTAAMRAGAEFTQVTGTHAAAVRSGFNANVDGRAVTVEVRYRF